MVPRHPENAYSSVDHVTFHRNYLIICVMRMKYSCVCAPHFLSPPLPHAKGTVGSFLGGRTRSGFKTGTQREEKTLRTQRKQLTLSMNEELREREGCHQGWEGCGRVRTCEPLGDQSLCMWDGVGTPGYPLKNIKKWWNILLITACKLDFTSSAETKTHKALRCI